MKQKTFLVSLLSVALGLQSCKQETVSDSTSFPSEEGQKIEAKGNFEEAEVTSPPNVPAPVGDREAKKLIVKLETIEKIGELADGTQYNFWTFNGTVPGAFIRARVGDEIKLHLKNNENSNFPHNIDLHAVNGPGGRAQ